MDLDGFSWIWVDLDGFGWVWMDLNENQGKSMKIDRIYENPGESMKIYENQKKSQNSDTEYV